MKSLVKGVLRSLGYEAHRVVPAPPAASPERPIAQHRMFLEDIRARGLRPSFLLDVGANAGLWTRMAKAIFPDARSLMIEPQLEMRQSLEAVCRDLPGVALVEAGAGAREGTLVLTIWDDLKGSSFWPEPKKTLIDSGKQREVPVRPIDAILQAQGWGVPDLVKLDVQGFELEALRGADSLFAKTELFILEVSLFPFIAGTPIVREVIAFMAERGYELYDIPGSGRRPYDGALGQVDFAFARTQGTLRRCQSWSAPAR